MVIDQKKQSRFSILSSPGFIIGLVLLILNDHFLKAEFGNWVTGKLSDFAGLFIFPMFLSVMFSRNKVLSYFLTAILFVIWKIPLSNPLLEWFNEIGIPLYRTIDYTDLTALLILPLGFRYQHSVHKSVKIEPRFLLLISVFAFTATTLPPYKEVRYTNLNRTYEFNYSKRELAKRMNGITIKYLNRISRHVDFDSKSGSFYTTHRGDTLAVIFDYRDVKDNDTLHVKSIMADIMISGDEFRSKLTLLSVYRMVPGMSEKDYKEKLIKRFERKVLKKLDKIDELYK